MNTVIIKPNGKKKQYGDVESLSACEPPIWAAIFANKYKASKIIDAEVENWSNFDVVAEVLRDRPDRIIILATGSHPSAHIQQKEVSLDLYNILKGQSFDVELLDRLPDSPVGWGKPRWDLLPIQKYRAHNWHCFGGLTREPYGAIYTSIGCPFNCTFCCVKDFYGKTYQARTLEAVYVDFDDLANLGIKNIKIMDELFILNKKRVHSICDYIISKGYDFNIWTYGRIDTIDVELLAKLKKAGVNWLAYGIESGSDEIRKNVMKGSFDKDKVREIVKATHDAGIHIVGNYMFGFWDDTLETMRETLDFAKELNCEYSNFYCTVAYPGSKLYDDMKEKGIDLPSNPTAYAQMSSEFKPLPTSTLSAEEVLKFRDESFIEYFNGLDYLTSMRNKFGEETALEIIDMTSKVMTRDILK